MTSSKTVYYFGYGANMSKEYLENRRRVFPSEIHTSVLKDYKLIMNMEGPNFIEPSFANIIKKPNMSVANPGIIRSNAAIANAAPDINSNNGI